MDFIELLETNKCQTIGRTYVKDKIFYFNFSGSGLKFHTDQPVTIEFYSPDYNKENNYPYITILTNDLRQDYALNELYQTVTINVHKSTYITIIKRTESSVSYAGIKNIVAERFLPFEANDSLKLEFYGDSITCGFGNLSTNPEDNFTTSTESFTDSYAYLTAQKLNAAYSAICVSGFPIYKSRWNEGFPIDSVAEMFNFCDYNEQLTYDKAIIWDNQKYVPDIVIINLGSNDNSYFTEGQNWVDELIMQLGSYEEAKKSPLYQLKLKEFKQSIINFFTKLFLHYGQDLKIIWALEMMDVEDHIVKLIKDAINEYHNPNIHYLKITSRDLCNIYGAKGHPSKQMHKIAADQLSNYIQKNIL